MSYLGISYKSGHFFHLRWGLRQQLTSQVKKNEKKDRLISENIDLKQKVRAVSLTALKYLCTNHGDQRVFFNLKSFVRSL